MPSSYTASLRLELQAQGENPNSWGQPKLNNLFTRVDFAIAGMFTKALTGDYTLTSSNSADDEARAAILKFTGAGAGPFTITIPSVSKEYKVENACTSASVVITTGAGATVTIQPTEIAEIICDGSNVKATGYNGKTEKQYLDQRVVEFGAVFSGFIGLFSGPIANIPSGWALCNGANGTPDLRNRFIVGAGDAYVPGSTGGANTVTLDVSQMPSHNHGGATGGQNADHTHSGYTDSQGNHAHDLNSGYALTGPEGGGAWNPGGRSDVSTGTNVAGAHTHNVATYGASSDHAHAIGSQGGGAGHENRPPYYALAYIMKL
jgi:microcystin-dependent protein